MADIIQIRDRMSATPKDAKRLLTVAQVLLFTGVRYERLTTGKTPGKGGSRSLKKA
ncbi:hypothetical protein IFT84_01485 [Rhizobium sp. CFBP 8762]|uniref:hypothetical protein n=1 Tax=Rhizobium sp. CFBP 8762 TaxID=2775279 RepID=UPI001784C9AD|nr:hypothetical protein [Rhizobium sp. CFBP 8762]MBD8553189.1 hypothetical protein [Rhizobium sp. CFBP 8762]